MKNSDKTYESQVKLNQELTESNKSRNKKKSNRTWKIEIELESQTLASGKIEVTNDFEQETRIEGEIQSENGFESRNRNRIWNGRKIMNCSEWNWKHRT